MSEHSNSLRAAVALSVSAAVWAAALNVLNQKYGTSIPDWTILIAVYIAAGFWLYWAWHTNFVQRRRRLIYTYRRMALIVMIVTGCVVGGSAGALLWWVVQREQHVRPENAEKAPTTTTATLTSTPSPATSITAPPISLSPSPSSSVSPSPSPATPTPEAKHTASPPPTPTVSQASTLPEEMPSAVKVPSSGPFYWPVFMNRLTPLHKGYKTYNIFSPAGPEMCQFYVRLGRMYLTSNAHVAVYVPQAYCAKAIFASIADNYQTILEELKAAVKNDGLVLLDLKVRPVIFVYSDNIAPPLMAALSETRQGLSFVIEQ